jgi:hypothetical protein
MNEKELQDMLGWLLINGSDDADAEPLVNALDGVSTFDDAGVMTLNKGLVLYLDDGQEYQLTIVKSR